MLRLLFDSSCKEPDQLAVDPAETKDHLETLQAPGSRLRGWSRAEVGLTTVVFGSIPTMTDSHSRETCKGPLTRPRGNPGSRRPTSNSSTPLSSGVTPGIHCANLSLISTQLTGPWGPYTGHSQRTTDLQATSSHEGQVCPTPGKAQGAEEQAEPPPCMMASRTSARGPCSAVPASRLADGITTYQRGLVITPVTK